MKRKNETGFELLELERSQITEYFLTLTPGESETISALCKRFANVYYSDDQQIEISATIKLSLESLKIKK